MQWCIRRYRGEPNSPSYTAGYSGILFAWYAVSCFIAPINTGLFGLNLSPFIMLFVYMALSQFLLPNVSFTGHLSGVIVGLIIGGGGFKWYGSYLALCLLIWSGYEAPVHERGTHGTSRSPSYSLHPYLCLWL